MGLLLSFWGGFLFGLLANVLGVCGTRGLFMSHVDVCCTYLVHTCAGISCLGKECKYVPNKHESAMQNCPKCHQPFPDAVPLAERRAFSTIQRMHQGTTASSARQEEEAAPPVVTSPPRYLHPVEYQEVADDSTPLSDSGKVPTRMPLQPDTNILPHLDTTVATSPLSPLLQQRKVHPVNNAKPKALVRLHAAHPASTTMNKLFKVSKSFEQCSGRSPIRDRAQLSPPTAQHVSAWGNAGRPRNKHALKSTNGTTGSESRSPKVA